VIVLARQARERHAGMAEAGGSGRIDHGIVEQQPAAICRLRTPGTSLPLASRAARRPTDRGAVGSTSSSLPPAGTRCRARRGSWPWTRARTRPSRAAPAPREHMLAVSLAHGAAGHARGLEVRPHAGDELVQRPGRAGWRPCQGPGRHRPRPGR
jgi:hypothetical protein